MSVGLAGILGVAFIVLKLTGVIAWPWIWVLAPFWIGLVLGLIMFIFVSIVSVFAVKKASKRDASDLLDFARMDAFERDGKFFK